MKYFKLKWFFEGDEGDVDIFRELREILDDPEHPENYWLSELQDDGRLKCHFCPSKHMKTISTMYSFYPRSQKKRT